MASKLATFDEVKNDAFVRSTPSPNPHYHSHSRTGLERYA